MSTWLTWLQALTMYDVLGGLTVLITIGILWSGWRALNAFRRR